MKLRTFLFCVIIIDIMVKIWLELDNSVSLNPASFDIDDVTSYTIYMLSCMRPPELVCVQYSALKSEAALDATLMVLDFERKH